MAASKRILFAFRGDPMCFVHVLLNGIDLHERNLGGEIVLEGEAITLVPAMSQPGHFLHNLYLRAIQKGLMAGACRACSAKLKMTEMVELQDIPLIGEMNGHPSMADYVEKGYEIVTF